MRHFALASFALVGMTTAAATNGRPAATSSIQFRPGDEQDIAAGMTFGLVLSHDGGATWQWMCEKAVHSGGTYDPVFEWSSKSSALFATTFDGFRVMRDGCSFDATALASGTPPTFMSAQAIGPNGDLFVAASDKGDGKIYKSSDDGKSFLTVATPGQPNDYWVTIAVAPSDSKRVYLTGFRPIADNDKEFLLFKSVDGGQTYTPMSSKGFITSMNSTIEIAGISKTDSDLVFARVTAQDGNIADAVYRSTDGGDTTWEPILTKGDSLHAFVVRANGDLVAATPTLGAFVSHDNGEHWQDLVNPPHLNCLVENAAGELWGCTRNFGSMQVMADGYGIMKTKDLATWTPVMKFQAGTFQKDECETNVWCGLRDQLGITANPTNCRSSMADTTGVGVTPSPKGCCHLGVDSAPGLFCIAGVVGAFLTRPHRRRS
jgi:hypothetical protein